MAGIKQVKEGIKATTLRAVKGLMVRALSKRNKGNNSRITRPLSHLAAFASFRCERTHSRQYQINWRLYKVTVFQQQSLSGSTCRRKHYSWLLLPLSKDTFSWARSS